MISFIVPAYNEERGLGRTLAAIHATASDLGEPYELIVVDDASTDGTAMIAEAAGARVEHVHYRQIASTRNAGARVARGSILIFVDADTVVPPATLRASMDALRRGAVGGGAFVRLDGRLPFYGRLLVWILRSAMRLGRLAAGCYVFCTRHAFDMSGGFDERLFATEEIALSRSLGRLGRFVILRQQVETSGRKLRTHSAWEVLRLTPAIVRNGSPALRTRAGLELWYGSRRIDPETGR
jgi:glycosyltransferase involved in cell wall biosynthesis